MDNQPAVICASGARYRGIVYQLRTLGGLAVERNGSPLDALVAQRKALALLAIIAAERQPGREKVMALLWPESSTERARGALNQALHSLRRQLDPNVVLGTAELRLNTEIIESDIAQFEDALERTDLPSAVRLYRGSFLDAVNIDGVPEFERWVDAQRDRLARNFANAVERLARASAQAGEHEAAAERWRMLQAADPMNSRIARELIQALDAAGNRAGALRHGEIHSALLRAELDSEPDAAFNELLSALRTRAPSSQARPKVEPRAQPMQVAPAGLTGPPPAAPQPFRLRNRLVPAALVLGVAVFVTIAVANRRSNAGLKADRVAVMTLVNRTGNSALDPIGKMAADWITRGLAATGLVDVVDVGAVYASSALPSALNGAHQLARLNGAGLVASGSYYRSGDSLHFSVTLEDVGNGKVLRVIEPVASNAGAPLQAVEELRRRVVAALATELDPNLNQFATQLQQPPRYDAYQEFVWGQATYWGGDFAASIPHFRRAFQLDTMFTLAAIFVGNAAVGTAQCELADSVNDALSERTERLRPSERLTLTIIQARCDTDWEMALRANRERASVSPRSTQVQWTISANARRAHRPAEALAVLKQLDPEHDLGWLPDLDKVFYWREVAAAQHALGDFNAELALGNRLAKREGGQLAGTYFAGRALAAQKRERELLRVSRGMENMKSEPALVAGEIAGRQRAALLATPGWVLFQLATEAAAHGSSAAAEQLAERAVEWFAERGVNDPESAFTRAQALLLLERFGGATELLSRLVQTDSSNIDFRGELGVASALSGERRRAEEVDAWLAQQGKVYPPGLPQLYRARIAAVLGERKRALDLLRQLPHAVHPTEPLFFHADPALRILLGTREFETIIGPRG